MIKQYALNVQLVNTKKRKMPMSGDVKHVQEGTSIQVRMQFVGCVSLVNIKMKILESTVIVKHAVKVGMHRTRRMNALIASMAGFKKRQYQLHTVAMQ